MRDVAGWKGGTLASTQEGNQLPEGAVFGAALKNAMAEGTSHGSPVDAHVIGRLTDGDSALNRVLEDEPSAARRCVGRPTEPSPAAPLLASGPGIETRHFAGQQSGPRINGEAVHTINAPGRAKVLDSAVRDVTPYTPPLRQARLRIEQLVTANRRKDEFLAILSHELRSPLGAIQNCVCFLSSQAGENLARQRAHALIERQVRRMTQLVDDLLDVSRINHGRLRLQRERIDLRVVVNHAIETLASDINERHQQLITALPDTPVWLRADPWRLEQVFVNLLANASKYTDAGGVLELWLHPREVQAVVRIRDSGMGIAPDALPHIFDLFRQADEAAPRSKSGLGIGLALVRNLVEMHGGSVSAASAGPEQGSEFTVRLPRESPEGNKPERS